MNRNRILLLLVLIGIGGVTGVMIARARATKNEASVAIAAFDRSQADTMKKIAALEAQITTNAQRAQAIESDNTLLKEALVRAQAAQAKVASTAASVTMTRQEVEARFQRARSLGKSGDPAEALRELLWCMDEGVKRLSAGVSTAQGSMILSTLSDLAKRYEPAADVLRERRDAFRQRVLAGPGGRDSVADYAGILRALGEEKEIVSLFDEVPKGDRRRVALAIYGAQQLVDAKRYDLAMEGPDPVQRLSTFEMMRNTPLAATSRNGQQSEVIRTSLQSIEILAGGGDLPHARELMDKLFSFDASPETRALVQQRLDRAGHPELMKPAP
jgi:hypothetical protein